MPDPNQNNDNQNPVSPTVMDISSVDQPVITPSSDSTAPSVIPPPVTPPADPIVAPVNVPPIPPETQATDATNQVSEIPSFLHSTDLPPLAPDFQNVSGGADTVNKTEDKNVPDANSGTNAPFPDLPITTGSPKKKFGGGKIIATILGIFLLVGGIAGGVILIQQNQNISEKAGSCAAHPCGPGLRCDGNGGCIPSNTPEGEEGNVESVDPPDSPWTGGGDIDENTGGCVTQCGGAGLAFDFCLPAGSTKTCNQEALARGYTVPVGSGCQPGQTCSGSGWICKEGINGYSGGPCTGNNNVPGSGNIASVPNCFCGTIQIDGGPNDGTYKMECGCGGNQDETSSDNPTTPPTTPPTISAQCQNIKAYSSTWTLLTDAQLSTLTPSTVVNFCVLGTASEGTFDRAKFTINTVAQAETTTKRPTTNDFCQSYAIPAGVTSFNLTAQIHHATLGWK